MPDTVTFLGTAGDSLVFGKQIRASGGIILNISDNQFVLDPGPSCLLRAKMLDINIRDTIAIIATHAHTLHTNDLNAVIEGLTVNGLDRMGVVLATKQTIDGTEHEIPSIKKSCKEYVERVIEIEAGKKIGINNVNMTFTKTLHSKSDGVGVIFETPKYKLGYVSDTLYSEEVAEQYKECDVLILNCKNPQGFRDDSSMNADDIIMFLRRCKPSKAIITHFGIKMIQSDPLSQARIMQQNAKVDVTAAVDGFVLTPAAHAKSNKQARLEEFKHKYDEEVKEQNNNLN